MARVRKTQTRTTLVVTDYDGVDPTGVSDSSAGIQAAFDDSASSKTPVAIPAGTYNIGTTLTFVGTRTSLVCDPDAKLNWIGSTAGPAIRFGDGGTTATTGISVYDLTVVDDTDGTTGLIALDDCDRSNFHGVYATANGLKSAGSGLVLKNDSIINTFHKLKVFGPAVGVDLLSTSIANKFFDPMIESAATAGMRVPFGATAVAHNTVFGGTIENCSGPGVLIQNPSEGLAFSGTYFELNATDVKLDYAAGSSVTYNFRDCRFKSSSTDIAIDIDAIARVIVTGSNWADCTLAQLNNASARYIGEHNVSADSSAEVDNVAGGSVLTTNLSGAGILGLAGLAGLTMEGYRVPVAQRGTGVSVTAGGSQTVVFPTAFQNAPVVIPSVTVATDDVTIVCDGINLAQVTFRNRGAVDATISWVAIDVGDLN